MNRAEELIADLEAEIVKRDARIAELNSDNKRLREALRDALWCMQSAPSCQSGLVVRCCCRKCVYARGDAALAANK